MRLGPAVAQPPNRGVRTRRAQPGVRDDDDALTGLAGAQAVLDERQLCKLRV